MFWHLKHSSSYSTPAWLTLLYAPHAEQMAHLVLAPCSVAYPLYLTTHLYKVTYLTALKCNMTPVTFTWESLNREIPLWVLIKDSCEWEHLLWLAAQVDVNKTVKLYFSKQGLISDLLVGGNPSGDVLDISLLFPPVTSIAFLLSVGWFVPALRIIKQHLYQQGSFIN